MPNAKQKASIKDELPVIFLGGRVKIVIKIKIHMFLLYSHKKYVQLHSQLLSTFIVSNSAVHAGIYTLIRTVSDTYEVLSNIY